MKLEREDGVTYLNRDAGKEEGKLSSLQEAEALKARLLNMIKTMTNALSEPIKDPPQDIPTETESAKEQPSTIEEMQNMLTENMRDRLGKELERLRQNEVVKSAIENSKIKNEEIKNLRNVANMRMYNISAKEASIIKADILKAADALQKHIDGLEAKIIIASAELNRIKNDLGTVIENIE
jgi:hypothetical protein